MFIVLVSAAVFMLRYDCAQHKQELGFFTRSAMSTYRRPRQFEVAPLLIKESIRRNARKGGELRDHFPFTLRTLIFYAWVRFSILDVYPQNS
jgi:hypothetical protein